MNVFTAAAVPELQCSRPSFLRSTARTPRQASQRQASQRRRMGRPQATNFMAFMAFRVQVLLLLLNGWCGGYGASG